MSSTNKKTGTNKKSIQMLMGRDVETNKFVVDAKCNVPATPRGSSLTQIVPSSGARSASVLTQG